MSNIDHLIVKPKDKATLCGVSFYLSKLHNASVSFGFYQVSNGSPVYPTYPKLTTEYDGTQGTWFNLCKSFEFQGNPIEIKQNVMINYHDIFELELLKIEKEALDVSIYSSDYSSIYLLILAQFFLNDDLEVWLIKYRDGFFTEQKIGCLNTLKTQLSIELNKSKLIGQSA